MPEEILQNERIFDYKWIAAWDVTGPGGSGTMKKCNILRFYFNTYETVENVYKYSYTPNGMIRSNKACRFNMSGATRIGPPTGKSPASGQHLIYPSVGGLVFIAGSRTSAHINQSYQDVYQKAISDLVSFLQSEGILLSSSRGSEIPQFEETFQISKLLDMARMNNAGSLLLIAVDRPPAFWVEVIVLYYDLSGRLQWEERVSSDGEMGFGNAIKELEQKIAVRIDNSSFPISLRSD